MTVTDIVPHLRQGISGVHVAERLMDSAADTIEFLRAEVDRLNASLDKCHAALMRANSPVVDSRNSKESV